jgi:hypothetical protein
LFWVYLLVRDKLGGRQAANLFRNLGDRFQPNADLELVQLLAGKQLCRCPFGQVFRAHFVRQIYEGRSHAAFIRMQIGLLVGRNVPNRHHQLAGNGYNRFGLSKAELQPGKLLSTPG